MKQKLCFDGSLCVTARHEAVQNDLLSGWFHSVHNDAKRVRRKTILIVAVLFSFLSLVSCGRRQDSEEGLAIFKYNESAEI